jgi:hypothetical protein
MLSFSNRLKNYFRQNGAPDKLTPRQRRRVQKKLSHQLKNFPVVRPVGDEEQHRGDEVTIAFRDEATDASFEAPCPTCGQSGDQPCLTASGHIAKSPHKGRQS